MRNLPHSQAIFLIHIPCGKPGYKGHRPSLWLSTVSVMLIEWSEVSSVQIIQAEWVATNSSYLMHAIARSVG